jgi:hypothetical protein
MNGLFFIQELDSLNLQVAVVRRFPTPELCDEDGGPTIGWLIQLRISEYWFDTLYR